MEFVTYFTIFVVGFWIGISLGVSMEHWMNKEDPHAKTRRILAENLAHRDAED